MFSVEGRFIAAMALGIATGAFVFSALERTIKSYPARKAIAIGSFSSGIVVTLWLLHDSTKLVSTVQIVGEHGIILLIAVISAAILAWKEWFRK